MLSIVFAVFLVVALLQLATGLRLETYAYGLSLVRFSAIVPGTCSLVKYYYQIRTNVIKKSTAGISHYAIWSDFLGNVFCFT